MVLGDQEYAGLRDKGGVQSAGTKYKDPGPTPKKAHTPVTSLQPLSYHLWSPI